MLAGEADFAALRAHFEPELQIYVGLKTQELDACFEQLFASWEMSVDESVAKLQAGLRECWNLRCKPTEQQLLTKFLAAMPDSGPWGQRKVMWTESTMSADGESTNATLVDMINKARMAYLQLKNSPEAKTGARAFAARVGKGNWLPPPGEKREYEQWVLRYSVVWMGSFGVIIAGKLYESFDAFAYFCVCGGLALPLA